MAKLGLGTVQFGLDYGLTNRNGQTAVSEVARILAAAAGNGVLVLDTAPLYGESERVLGGALEGNPVWAFRIVTKTPAFHQPPLTAADADALERTFLTSLEHLRRPSVYGLLLHHAEDALTAGSEWLFERMNSLRARGLVEKIGISAYSPAQVDAVVERHAIELVQAPFNVMDQRFRQSGCFARLRRRGIEIHTRSAFLQGGLLDDPAALPAHFAAHRWRFHEFHALSLAAGLSPLAAALQFVLRSNEIDACIVGVTSAAELAQVLEAASTCAPAMDVNNLATEDEDLVHPGRWKR